MGICLMGQDIIVLHGRRWWRHILMLRSVKAIGAAAERAVGWEIRHRSNRRIMRASLLTSSREDGGSISARRRERSKADYETMSNRSHRGQATDG